MNLKRLTTYSLFFLMLVFFLGCDENSLIEEQFVNANLVESNEVHSFKIQQQTNATNLFLIHLKNESILAKDIINNFLNGWQFQEEVTIYGYLPLDKIWVVIEAKNTKPEMEYSKVRIELSKLIPQTEEWILCIKDIHEIVDKMPSIIVLDQDL